MRWCDRDSPSRLFMVISIETAVSSDCGDPHAQYYLFSSLSSLTGTHSPRKAVLLFIRRSKFTSPRGTPTKLLSDHLISFCRGPDRFFFFSVFSNCLVHYHKERDFHFQSYSLGSCIPGGSSVGKLMKKTQREHSPMWLWQNILSIHRRLGCPWVSVEKGEGGRVCCNTKFRQCERKKSKEEEDGV